MLDTFTLKNGLKVATYSIPEMRSVFLSLACKSGWILDPEEKSGLAHFMEHILVQGTPSFPNVEAFSDYMEKLAGSYNAITEAEAIRFVSSAPARYLEEIVQIGAEVFLKPLFPSEAAKRERDVIISEIRQKQDTLAYKNYRFFAQNRYKEGNPMRKEGGGTVDTVQKIQRKDLISFWKDFFYPRNTYLVIVGGFQSSQVKKLIAQYFNQFKSDKIFPGFPEFGNPDMSDWQVAIREDEKYQSSYLTLSFPSIAGKVPLEEHLPRSVIANILGQLRGSRLYRTLRQRRGLVYDVGFGTVSFQNFGYAYVSSQTSPAKLEKVVETVTDEMARFLADGPTEEEVRLAKDYHINRTLMRFDHPASIADWIEGDLLWEDKIYLPDEYVKKVEKVGMKEIREFMSKYWELNKINLVLQGPLENSPENVKKYNHIIERLRGNG